jgi:hypothetical protein
MPTGIAHETRVLVPFSRLPCAPGLVAAIPLPPTRSPTSAARPGQERLHANPHECRPNAPVRAAFDPHTGCASQVKAEEDGRRGAVPCMGWCWR